MLKSPWTTGDIESISLIQLVVSREACQLSVYLSNFLFVESSFFTVLAIAKATCRSINAGQSMAIDYSSSFTTFPYRIDHGDGPGITSMLVLVSSPKERSRVTAIALLRRCRIVACIHYSNMFFYIR